MSEQIRSLADALRSFSDGRLAELLRARGDLASPVPGGIGPLAARAAATTSVQRALSCLILPELQLLEALVVLPDGSTPRDLAAAVDAPLPALEPALSRLRTLALVWGETRLHPVRALTEILRSPAGLAPSSPQDPSPEAARRLVAAAPAELSPMLARLAAGPARIEGGDGSPVATALVDAGLARPAPTGGLVIPRSVHLALRGGRILPGPLATERPPLDGPVLGERIPGTRTAQAVDAAFESLRILATLRCWDEDPPAVLRRGGIPQRDLRRLAQQADASLLAYVTVLQAAWSAGLLGHDGERWALTADWDGVRRLPAEERWAEIALAWARGRHLASAVGTNDPTGTPRAALSEATRRPGVRTRRCAMLRDLFGSPDRRVTPEMLARSLTWAFPLVPGANALEEARAVLAEGAVLGVVLDGALTELGRALVDSIGAAAPGAAPGAVTEAGGGGTRVDRAEDSLARTLARLAPPPVQDVLLDADLTATIPGRPAERLLPLLEWTEVISRGGALTLRFSTASVRRALGSGRDAEELITLLTDSSRTPIPQPLLYLLHDERRRHGQVRIGRAHAYITAEEEVLTLFQSSPESAPLALVRLAPTVAVTASDPGTVLQTVRRSGLSAIAVGPGGHAAPEAVPHALRGGPVDADLERAEEPPLRLSAEEAVARLREAERHGGHEASVADRLLAAIADSRPLRLGIVDGRGGTEVREAVPLSLDGGRLRARDVRGDEEFTVLVHRVTLG